MYLIVFPSPTRQQLSIHILNECGEKVIDNGVKNDTYHHLFNCGLTFDDLIKDINKPQTYFKMEMTYRNWCGRLITENIPIFVTWFDYREIESVKKEWMLEEA